MVSRLQVATGIVALLLIVPAASAGSGTVVPETNDYGVTASNTLIIPGTAFAPSDSATTYTMPFLFLQRQNPAGSSEFTHPIHLPPGALIESVTARVIDTSPTADVVLRVCMVYANDTNIADLKCDTEIGFLSGASAGSGGFNAINVNWNRTLKNLGSEYCADCTQSYVVLVHLGFPGDGQHSLHSVKVTWRRQVTPSPAVATFSDVPTAHPFFRFIEALAASGITAGCGGGQFCPNAPITRGEMAVFLSAALGLHWAP